MRSETPRPQPGGAGRDGESQPGCRPQDTATLTLTSRPVLRHESQALLVAALVLVAFTQEARSATLQHALDVVVQAWADVLTFQGEVEELTQ